MQAAGTSLVALDCACQKSGCNANAGGRPTSRCFRVVARHNQHRRTAYLPSTTSYYLLHVYCCSGATSDGRRLLRNECNTCGLLMQRTVGGALRYGRRHAWVIGATYNLEVKVPPMPVPGLLRGRYTRSSPNKYPFRYMWALGRV